MINKEKVIEGLEETEIILSQAVDRGGEMAVMGAFKCLNHVTDVLALLKDQEVVEPVLIIDRLVCGNCNHPLEQDYLVASHVWYHEQYNYCPYCGKKVKWDEIHS